VNSISIVVRRSSEQLQQRLERESASLQKLPFECRWSDCGGGRMLVFAPRCSADSSSRDTLIRALAAVLIPFITEDLKVHLLRDQLRFHNIYFGKEERREILNRACVDLERGSFGRRRGFYRGSIERYLRASCPGGPPVHLNIEGFYNFRMRSFQRELQQALDSAIDIHFAEKEYGEFIRLLKYFLNLQQPKIELLHLSVDPQGRLQIMDRCFQRVDPLEWEELGADDFDEGDDYEDIFVSMLVSIAPRRIMLHQSVLSRYPRAVKSLRSIFEDRLFFCKNCAYCRQRKLRLVFDDSKHSPRGS
jgi:putative sporulation protein YtxC